MNNPIVRNIVAVVAGVVIAGLVVMIVEGVGHMIWPPPEGLDITKPEDQARIMREIPQAAKVAVIVAWFLGSLAGAVAALAISRKALPGWIVALVMVALSVATTQMFPHPVWMVAAAVVLPLIAMLLAKRLMAAKL